MGVTETQSAKWKRAARGHLRVFLLCSHSPAIVAPMPEPDDKLTPARPQDLRACIAYALTSDGRLAKTQLAELMASIVAGAWSRPRARSLRGHAEAASPGAWPREARGNPNPDHSS